MNKKCFEIFVRLDGKNTHSEYVFAIDFKEAKIIARRQSFGSYIIKIAEADIDGLLAS